jgi:hypothetical protein
LFVLSLFNLCMFKIFASNDGHSQTLWPFLTNVNYD